MNWIRCNSTYWSNKNLFCVWDPDKQSFPKFLAASSFSLSSSSPFVSGVIPLCLAALDLWADVELPFNCFIIQNRLAVQSMRRSMDWTLEDNMVEGLLFCATLTVFPGKVAQLQNLICNNNFEFDHSNWLVRPD